MTGDRWRTICARHCGTACSPSPGSLSSTWRPCRRPGSKRLPRWDHPKRGLISDAVIIPLAAACGLMTPLNRWLVAAACAEAVAWPRPWIVSMTLLPEQFTLPGIVETVAEAMGATGLTANRLESGSARRH